MRLRRRLLRNAERQHALSERPKQPHTQSLDYAEPPTDRTPLNNPGGAEPNNGIDDEANGADDEAYGDACDEADGNAYDGANADAGGS